LAWGGRNWLAQREFPGTPGNFLELGKLVPIWFSSYSKKGFGLDRNFFHLISGIFEGNFLPEVPQKGFPIRGRI